MFWEWCVTIWAHIQADFILFQNSHGYHETPPRYTKTEKVKMVSGKVKVCRDGRGIRWNTTVTVQK